jgi:hypothetical protein
MAVRFIPMVSAANAANAINAASAASVITSREIRLCAGIRTGLPEGRIDQRLSYPQLHELLIGFMSRPPVSIDRPVIFDAFLTNEQFAAASEQLDRIRFGFGAISTNPNLPIWCGEIDRASLPVQLALGAVCQLAGVEFDLVCSHVNLQTHGLDGAFHRDGGDPDGQVTHALNWYVHPYDWPVECGGYLVVGDDIRNLRAILPSRNSAVLIPADVLHCALSPSLIAGAMARISLTLKLKLKNAI